MTKIKIIKLKFAGKWLELWLEGLPFEKKSEWDASLKQPFYTEEDQYNFSCKPYMLENWYDEIKGEGSFAEKILMDGWNFIVGLNCYHKDDRLYFTIEQTLKEAKCNHKDEYGNNLDYVYVQELASHFCPKCKSEI